MSLGCALLCSQIEELDITFDPIAMYHQLMVAADKQDFPVVPNTLDTALKDDKSCLVVTTARVRYVRFSLFVYRAGELVYVGLPASL